MKKITALLTAVMLLSSAVTALADKTPAEDKIKVYVDNDAVEFTHQQPIIRDDRTLVPIRAVFEKAGAQVDWDQPTQTAILTKDTYKVTIKLNETYLFKNGVPVSLDVPSIIENDSILIPVRSIGEAMDFGVTWDGLHRSVLVATDNKAYRPNAGWKKGFKDLKDAGFYLKNDVNDLFYDLNGDGTKDKINFRCKKEGVDPILQINDKDFSNLIPKVYNNAKALAIVDVRNSDKYTEIAVIDGEDSNAAWFYRYNGLDLIPLQCNSTTYGDIPFLEKLFVDGIENIISDFDGMCWLDLMVTPGIYTMDEQEIQRYSLGVNSVVNRNLFKTYSDNMTYHYQKVNSYEKGTYLTSETEQTIMVKDLPETFRLLDYYVDDTDPSNFEFYVEYKDGTKAVLWSYTA